MLVEFITVNSFGWSSMTITLQNLFLVPAVWLVRFIASLFGLTPVPYGWEVVLSGFVALTLFVMFIKAVIALIKRMFGFYGKG